MPPGNSNFCRSMHLSKNDCLSSNGPVNDANNRSPLPHHNMIDNNTNAYMRDPSYYGPDDIGIFLVDGILFKAHATHTFGPRPVSLPEPIKSIIPTYIEDILPKLPGSSDSNPIPLPGVTAKQFRNYLLAVTCRPGDEKYSVFTTRYNEYWDRDRFLSFYALYVDIACLARLFGTIKLEGLAIDMLYSVFKEPNDVLTRELSEDWSADTLFHLRTLSRNTKLEKPVKAFIQTFISINLDSPDASDPLCPPESLNVRACVDLYHIVKDSDHETELLGCVLLSLLSLGHRSWVWSKLLGRKDRAILYAAQVQFVDATSELGNLHWLGPYPPNEEISEYEHCHECESKIRDLWKLYFGELHQGMGSCLPLKDVSSLSQVAETYWFFHTKREEMKESCLHCEGEDYDVDSACSLTGLSAFLGENIRMLYDVVASRYKSLAEEV